MLNDTIFPPIAKHGRKNLSRPESPQRADFADDTQSQYAWLSKS